MKRSTTEVVLFWLAATVFLGALPGCNDSNLTGGAGAGSKAQRLRDSLLVSGPLGQGGGQAASLRGASANGAPGATAASGSAQYVYISLPPGSLNGDSARISSGAGSGGTASALMSSGGFDPVAVIGQADDSVDIAVFAGGKEIGPVSAFVPPSRPPSVVRTSPAKGRTDVAMNQMITIVFSQPLNVATVGPSSIQLTQNGAQVPASLDVQAAQPWVVHIVPTSLLAPATTYDIAIGTAITDINGKPLEAPVTTDFTTGTTADLVASVTVLSLAGFHQPTGLVIAAVGGKVTFIAYKASASGDTLTPTTGAPIVWSSDSSSVATVDSVGEVTAIAPGTATISACSGSICGHGSIIVNSAVTGVTPIRLGDLGGGFSRLWAMSAGYAVGYSKITPTPSNGGNCFHAFVWTQARGMEDLDPDPNHCGSSAWMVNANGTVLGDGGPIGDVGPTGWWIWRRATGMQVITYPDNVNVWSPGGINANEEIVFIDTSGTLVGLTSPTGTRIGALPAPHSGVGGLNDVGQTLVNTTVQDSTGAWTLPGSVAYVWDVHQNRITYTLAPGNSLFPGASALNNQGVVVGAVTSAPSFADGTAFRWTPSGGFTYLPKQGPGVTTAAMSVNSAGDATVYLESYQHVGQDSVYVLRSAVWTAGGALIALGDLGGTWTAANGINDSHVAAGHTQVGSSSGPLEAVIWNYSSVPFERSPSQTTSVAPLRAAPSSSRTQPKQGNGAALDERPTRQRCLMRPASCRR